MTDSFYWTLFSEGETRSHTCERARRELGLEWDRKFISPQSVSDLNSDRDAAVHATADGKFH